MSIASVKADVASFEVAALIILVSLFLWQWYTDRDLPPGPWGLPFVGYFPFVGHNLQETFVKLGKKYGNVFSLRMGQRLVVVLNDYASIKEAFVKQGMAFLARPPGFAMALHDHEKGIFNDKGESYLKNRRFLISTLRDFGMGKNSLVPVINEEIRRCMDTIASANGELMDPHDALTLSALNIVCLMSFGHRFEFGDQRLEKVLKNAAKHMELSDPTIIRPYFPILKFLPFGKVFTRQTTMQHVKKGYLDFHAEFVQEHLNSNNEEVRDYIDAYLSQRKKNGHQSEAAIDFDMDYLLTTLEILFLAGAETVSTTVKWVMLYLTAYPHVQTKLQEEVDRVVGSERVPSINDQPKMNYTKATIMELNRIASVVPLGIVHGNTEDVNFLGNRIPKGSIVFPNIWAVHYDKKLFDDPTSFRPERFLDEMGNVTKCDYVIPFAIGKRSCVGESLAKMELFLYLTSLVQRFTLLPDEYDPKTFKCLPLNGRSPYPFTIRAVQRENFHLA